VTDDTRVGSQQEFDRMVNGDKPELALVPDSKIDHAFKLMRGPDADEPAKENVVALVTTKSDDERAAALKAALRVHAEKLCEVITTARRDGILLSWQLGWDAAGRAFVQSIDAMKPL